MEGDRSASLLVDGGGGVGRGDCDGGGLSKRGSAQRSRTVEELRRTVRRVLSGLVVSDGSDGRRAGSGGDCGGGDGVGGGLPRRGSAQISRSGWGRGSPSGHLVRPSERPDFRPNILITGMRDINNAVLRIWSRLRRASA